MYATAFPCAGVPAQVVVRLARAGLRPGGSPAAAEAASDEVFGRGMAPRPNRRIRSRAAGRPHRASVTTHRAQWPGRPQAAGKSRHGGDRRLAADAWSNGSARLRPMELVSAAARHVSEQVYSTTAVRPGRPEFCSGISRLWVRVSPSAPGQGHVRLASKQGRGGLYSREIQQFSPCRQRNTAVQPRVGGRDCRHEVIFQARRRQFAQNVEPPPICPRRSIWRCQTLRAGAPRTRLADNGTRQGGISGCLFNIGRWECSQGEGTSADGEPLSSAPVCGKESRDLGGDARDLGRLGDGHGGRGRHRSRCLSPSNSRDVYGLTRNRQVATHQDRRHASSLGYRSTWDSNCRGTHGDRQDHFRTNRPRISSGSHSPGDRPPDADADGCIHRNG